MKHSTPLTRLKWILIPALLLLCTAGVVSAKYVTTIEKSSTVTFSVKLADSVVLQEHEVIRNDDGSYKLATQENSADNTEKLTTDRQTYKLIPGLDIPKDPHVVITNKTDIPAYLYIEIVDNTLDSYEGTKTVTYTTNSNWESTTDKQAQNGGNMYVYTGGGDKAVALTSANTPAKIEILANNEVTVSQHVKHADTDGSDVITIYAYLVEAVD